MSYIVNFSDSSKTSLIVEDGTVNSTTDISLVGRSVSGYGKYIAQNFLNILENFSSSTPPPRPTVGQLWFDTSLDKLKVYTSNSGWKSVDGLDLSPNQPTVDESSDGDFWFDISSNTFYIFYNNSWISLIDSDSQNRMVAKTRYDTSNVPRKTLECVVNNNVVFVVSSDVTEWTPKSTGENQERLPNGSLMAFEYPVIKRGINLNSISGYTINNFDIEELNSLFIDVGRGKVFLENNIYDGDGSGITFRTDSNPTVGTSSGSIFSIRNKENHSKLWVGNGLTTAGNNNFAIGTPEPGAESNPQNYRIFLGNGGDISAKSVSGDWVATENEAIDRQLFSKVLTPFTGGRIATTAINERLSNYDTAINGNNNVSLMTPLLTRQVIDYRLNNLNLENGQDSSGSGTIITTQTFSSPSLLIYDRVSSGSNETLLSQNTWNPVPLNSIEFNSVSVEVSNNIISIPSGNHYIEWQAIIKSENGLDITNAVTRLYDVTNNTTIIDGQSITISNNQSMVLSGSGIINPATDIDVEIQVFVNQDDVYFRFGGGPSNTDEIYSMFKAFSVSDDSSSSSTQDTPEYSSTNAYLYFESSPFTTSPSSTIQSVGFNREVTFYISSQSSLGSSSKITFIGNGETVYGSANDLSSGNFPVTASTGGTSISSVVTGGIFMLPAGVRADFESYGSGGGEGSGPGIINYTVRPVL